jgi:hypothetical protein
VPNANLDTHVDDDERVIQPVHGIGAGSSTSMSDWAEMEEDEQSFTAKVTVV